VLAMTAARWVSDPLFVEFNLWCTMTGTWTLPMFANCLALFTEKSPRGSTWPVEWLLPSGYITVVGEQALGRLSRKVEAAGKVRIFALVDAFTQWILKPLHELIFTVLREIPQDGTFDQHRPLMPVLDEAIKGGQRVASLDLSAATDRLPVLLQRLLLSQLLGEVYATTWMRLLVNRDYSGLRYAVGQPMGALSSWAMLALTHHFIIQWAWWRVCQSNGSQYYWYPWYAVLGDDVFLLGGPLIDEYQHIMSELGVSISHAKSILGTKVTAEFAKAFFVGREDVSPISWTELAVARRSAAAALELRARHSSVTDKDLLRVLGVGDFAMTRLEKPVSRRVAAWKLLFQWADSGEKFPFKEPTSTAFAHFSSGPSWPRVPWAECVRYIAFVLARMLVASYASMVQAMVRSTSAPLDHLESTNDDVRTPADLLVRLATLNSSFEEVFFPSKELNDFCEGIERVAPMIERFVAAGPKRTAGQLEEVFIQYMEIRDLLNLIRVPQHLLVGSDLNSLSAERIQTRLTAFLVILRCIRSFTASWNLENSDSRLPDLV